MIKMETRVEKINDINKQTMIFEKAAAIIKSGGLVAFPTETVYGLGADGLNASACVGIYRAKGRPSDNPLILHVSDRQMIGQIAAEVTPLAERLLAAFCPGPLTLIMKKNACVPDSITGGLDTVGIRMPDNDIARTFIRMAGVPIAAPSANLSGRPSPTTAAAVLHDMTGRIPLILDGGDCRFGVESTIVDTTGDEAIILRPGAITPEMLAEVCEKVSLDPALAGENTVPKAPGMKYTHYAPQAPLTLVAAENGNRCGLFKKIIEQRQKQGENVGLIISAETAKELAKAVPEELIVNWGNRNDLLTIAAGLYEALRYFDDKKVDSLLAETVSVDGLGLAIMNRLLKAAGGRIIKE